MKLEPSFLREKSEYKSTYFPIPHYIEQNAFNLAKARNISIEEATAFIKSKFRSGEVRPSDREMVILAKDENMDRYKTTSTVYNYFKMIRDNKLRVAPTFTTYVGPEVRRSLYGTYITAKAKLRKGFKSLKFTYEMKGDTVNASFYDSLQNSCKIKINSLSGTHSSPGTIGFLKTGHSTLTSVCRVITSTANAVNEKFIAGNRHYFSFMITYCNILALGNDAKNHPIKETMAKYQLDYPTIHDAMTVIRRSTFPYWTNEDGIEKLRQLLITFTPDELAFFVYGMDMRAFEASNPAFVKKMFEDFNVTTNHHMGENPDAVFKDMRNGDLEVLALLNCAENTAGISKDDIIKHHPTIWNEVCSTGQSLANAHNYYAEFFRTFFRPNLLPPSIHDVPSMYRLAVPLSDTDSCVFINQDWVLKYYPESPFSQKANCVNYTMTYYITQLVAHSIAMLSMNLGLNNSQIGDLAMKNEYCFPVIWLTELAKHYYALKSAQEGNIYSKFKDETKGVNLRNSAASKDLNGRLYEFMRSRSEVIAKGGMISIKDVIRLFAETEKEIYTDIASGGSQFLRSMQTKDEDSYTQKGDAPAVKQHELWEEVFSHKYGPAPDLPYRAVSLKLSTKGKMRMQEWMDSIPDRTFVNRLQSWLERNGKKELTSIRLPIDIVQGSGIPEEILKVAQIREVVKMIMNPFYIVGSVLGLNHVNDKVSRLYADDFYTLEDLAEEDDEDTGDDGDE